MKRASLLIIAFVSSQATYADDAYTAWAEKACAQIAKTYQACGKKFEYDQGRFYFPKLGTSVLCTDGARRDFYDRMESMDIASILSIPYVTGTTPLPENRRNQDPGRLRVEDLLKSVYGQDEKSVWRNLIKVDFLGHQVYFQKNLGAANAFVQVGKDIELEMQKDPTIATFLKDILTKVERPSTMNWRPIAGTNRLSVHSFGASVDLIIKSVKAQYWLYDEMETNPEKAKQGEIAYVDTHFIPAKKPYFHPKVIEIFERHGFIWGGKWNHYGTMHFEYRPEFFMNYKIKCH